MGGLYLKTVQNSVSSDILGYLNMNMIIIYGTFIMTCTVDIYIYPYCAVFFLQLNENFVVSKNSNHLKQMAAPEFFK